MTEVLRRLLWPESVGILDAAPDNRWVQRILSSTRGVEYRGRVFPVTTQHESLAGLTCFPTVRDLPRIPDAAVVVSRGSAAVRAVEEAVNHGVRGIVVLAGGFAETGSDGAALQARLGEIARDAGAALIGPNCQGFINCLQPSAVWTADISTPLPPGRVAVISPSGVVSSGIMNQLFVRSVHTSYTVSFGNEAVVTAADLIEAFVEDHATRVIVAHLETLRDPSRFFAVCDRAAAADKPVVVLKVGRTPAARQAIQAHTGTLAGPDRIIDAQFRRHRIVRAATLDELVETSIALGGRRLRSPRISAFASSGAHVGLTSDAAASTVLEFPDFEPATAAKLTEGLEEPSHAAGNPLDIGSGLRGAVDTIAADPTIDAVLLITQTRRHPNGVTGILTTYLEIAERLHETSEKPIVVLSANTDVEASVSVRLAAAGVPVLAGLDTGLRALAHAYQYGRPEPPEMSTDGPDPSVLNQLRGLRRPLTGQAALKLVADAGMSAVRSIEAASVDAAVAAARKLGYPVTVKTGAPDVLHKSETRQVALNLTSADSVRKAARHMQLPILVQRHVVGGVELIIGLQADPQLGTCIAVGIGGVLTELLDAVVLRALPLRVGEAAEMLMERPIHRVLDGYRGAPPIDRRAVATMIERVAALGMAAGPLIASLDLNPVIASPAGLQVVDALLIPGGIQSR